MSPRRRDGSPGPTASAALAADLRERILSGALKPGDPLREEAIAESSRHSRHTVRTALATLVAERLAVQVPYGGIRVRNLTAEDLAALQQLRCALESEAVRLLCDRYDAQWPPEVTEPIARALDDLAGTAAESPDDWPSLARAHALVHRRLVEGCRSPRIEEAYVLLDSEMLLHLVNMRPSYSAHDLVVEHRAYVDEVREQGADAVRRHIDGGTLNAALGDG